MSWNEVCTGFVAPRQLLYHNARTAHKSIDDPGQRDAEAKGNTLERRGECSSSFDAIDEDLVSAAGRAEADGVIG